MNQHERRRKVERAIAILSEVTADILSELSDDDGLTADEVRARAGLPPWQSISPLFRVVLEDMVRHYEVESELKEGRGSANDYWVWRLAK